MTVEETKPCPICALGGVESRTWRDNRNTALVYFSCSRCGQYDLEQVLHLTKLSDLSRDLRHLASAWVYRQNKAGITPQIRCDTFDDWVSRLKHFPHPKSVGEKLDALLLLLREEVGIRYRSTVAIGPRVVAAIAAEDEDEVGHLVGLLKELEYVSGKPTECRLTAQGWRRIEELRRAAGASDSGFVAMWFDDSILRYRESASEAIRYCGYKPVIVDQEEFSGFIMDQVITLIRGARFIVADFTCACEKDEQDRPKVKGGSRGGVYWEAGFGYGLGRAVIHTCRNDEASRRRVHFDVDQYNTIFWALEELEQEIRELSEIDGEPTFPEKLASRILALVGRGSYRPSDAT